MARRSSIKKADGGKVGDEDMSEERIKQLQDVSVKDVDSAEKAEDDEDEDEKTKMSKVDDSDDDDDDDDDEDETDKSLSGKGLERKLRRAVKNLVDMVKGNDPSMRKEALFAKSMNGGALSDSEADELDSLVRGRPLGEPLRERVAPQMSKSFQKAIQSNSALEDLVKGVAGSHVALCDEIDHMHKSLDEVHCLLAKAIGAMGETLSSIHGSQGAIAEALDKSLSQPAHGPRSVGVRYSERGLNGTDSQAPARTEKALREMSKSAGSKAAHDAISQALFQFQTTKTIPHQVQAMIDSHLAEA